MKVAIIGAGISGLGAAHLLLKNNIDVHVFEKNRRAGGHAHTVTIEHADQTIDLDVGFIVYNERNYPRLSKLFNDLNVPTEKSDMSFSVHSTDHKLEWGGAPRALFAQKRNLIRPRFLWMLKDILRFNSLATTDYLNNTLNNRKVSLKDYIDKNKFGKGFTQDYLYPMGAAIWSSPVEEIKNFPAFSFISFFYNHGLLSLNDRPQWRTVSGGSKNYVARITNELGHRLNLDIPNLSVKRGEFKQELYSNQKLIGTFDHTIVATHGDTVLSILDDANEKEIETFSLFKTESNTGYLHTSESLMPKKKAAWASWNYRKEKQHTDRVALTYWMNKLQNLHSKQNIFITLNPLTPPPEKATFNVFEYRHPLYDQNTLRAQTAVEKLQGIKNTWFAGAYLGHGFHEDGLRAGQLAAEGILGTIKQDDTTCFTATE